jgi:hypothetical protein
MNGAEWLEAYTNASSNGLTSLAILLTMVSGYIAIAYISGEKLSTLQVVLINIVYVSSGTSVLLSNYGSVLDAATARAEAARLLEEVGSVMGIEGTPDTLALVVAGTNSLYLIISLFFMWQVRHTKSKRAK